MCVPFVPWLSVDYNDERLSFLDDVASSAAFPLPTFLTAWGVSAATKKTSPASTVVGGSPSTWYSSDPSRT
jgi:hypothetical protein